MRATLQTQMLVVLLVLALLIPLTGCGGGDGATRSVSGQVVDDGTLGGIQGARVVGPEGQETATDGDGSYVLRGLSTGAVTVALTAVGYETSRVTVPAGSADQSLGVTYLQPAPLANRGNVTGIITDGGSGLSGAVVQAAGVYATTRADGSYILYNVPTGFQTVLATTANGSKGGSINVTVTEFSTSVANIALSVQPPAPPVQ